MGPNFREPQSLNYSRCKNEIGRAIDRFDTNFRLKFNLEDTAMDLLPQQKKLLLKTKKIYNISSVIIDEVKRISRSSSNKIFC